MAIPTRATLHERLEAIRQQHGTTKKALSLACHRAPAYWAKMLGERYMPSYDVVRDFCAFYALGDDLTKSLLDDQVLSCGAKDYPALHPVHTYAFTCTFCQAIAPGVAKPRGWRVKGYRLHCSSEPCVRAAYARYKNDWQQRDRAKRAARIAAGLPAPHRKEKARDDGPWNASDWGYGTSHVHMPTMDLSPMAEAFLPPMPANFIIRRHGG